MNENFNPYRRAEIMESRLDKVLEWVIALCAFVGINALLCMIWFPDWLPMKVLLTSLVVGWCSFVVYRAAND
jgi:hypothetical protein